MSKLSAIRKTLEEKAIIAHAEEENTPLNLCMGWPQRIDFYISPKAPLYHADELNRFMDSLFPYMKHAYKGEFIQKRDSLIPGIICFDEKIGHSVTRIENDIIIDDEALAAAIEKEKRHSYKASARDYMRRINVRLYPSNEIIGEMLHHNLPLWKIPMELIREYHDDRNFLLKLLSRMQHKH